MMVLFIKFGQFKDRSGLSITHFIAGKSLSFKRYLIIFLCIVFSLYPRVGISQKTCQDYMSAGNKKDSLKDFSGAIKDYSEAIKLVPGSADPYYYRANAEFDLRDYKKAADDYGKTVSID